MVGWLVVGSDRCGRGLDIGVARATSAADGYGPGGTGKQRCEQVLDLVTGQPDQPGRWRVAGLFSHGRIQQW